MLCRHRHPKHHPPNAVCKKGPKPQSTGLPNAAKKEECIPSLSMASTPLDIAVVGNVPLTGGGGQ